MSSSESYSLFKETRKKDKIKVNHNGKQSELSSMGIAKMKAFHFAILKGLKLRLIIVGNKANFQAWGLQR